MLEVLYDKITKQVRAWNADMSVQGNFTPKPEEAVVILDTAPPTFKSDVYYVDLNNQVIVGNLDYLAKVAYQDQLAAEFNEAHEQAIRAYKNWGSLTLTQKDAVLKGLVKWALWKDGWLMIGVLD